MDKNPFEAALDRLRARGWIKDHVGYSTGPNCIRGALLFEGSAVDAVDVSFWKITHLEPRLNAAIILEVIREHYRDRCRNLATGRGVSLFNDHPDTTFADVERVLEKAAVKWEEERVLRND